MAAMLVSQTKEIIKILLLRVHQHGHHDVRWKPAIDINNDNVMIMTMHNDDDGGDEGDGDYDDDNSDYDWKTSQIWL